MRDRLLLPCPEALDRFALHLDGELGESDGRPLEDHLDACASCRDAARGLAAIHRDLLRRSALEESDPVPALLARARWEKASAGRARRTGLTARGPRTPWLPWAVAAGLAAALLVAALSGRRPETPRRPAPAVPLAVQPVEEPAPAPKPAPSPLPKRKVVVLREEAPAPTPRIESPPVAPALEPPAPAPRETASVPLPIARLEQAAGTVELGSGGADGIVEGETLAVRGASSRAVVAYPDGTRLFVSGETALAFGPGKAVTVSRGELAADVAPQRGAPMVFTTPGAEVKVLGTRLSVVARPDSTWVQVEKGRVQVTRRSDRWSIPLREGQLAVVEAGKLPVARALGPNLVADPGFEAGGKGWGGIWNRAMGRNYGGVDVAAGILRLTTERTPGWDREVFQDFPVAPGESVEAAGWLKLSGVGGKGVRLSLVWLSASGDFLEDLTASLRSKGVVLREDEAGGLAGTSDWTRLAARVVAPAGAKQVRMLVYVDADPSGPANAWLDDALLRRVPRAGR